MKIVHCIWGLNTGGAETMLIDIANELFLTENTIESYRKNLMVKLEARNVADLIVKGIEKGYIEVGYGQPS